MFTGIIQAIGRVRQLQPQAGDHRLSIAAPDLDFANVQVGDSIAVSGVCLTAVALVADGFTADVSNETLTRTAFRQLRPGSRVNLEKSLTLASPLGGHLVAGHVDGVGELVTCEAAARSWQLWVRAPAPIARYIAAKGSIAIDGVSLTVNEVRGAEFSVNIVPHTWSATTLSALQVGSPVNLEVDIIARYLERLLQGEHAGADNAGEADSISLAWLAEHGFFKS